MDDLVENDYLYIQLYKQKDKYKKIIIHKGLCRKLVVQYIVEGIKTMNMEGLLDKSECLEKSWVHIKYCSLQELMHV